METEASCTYIHASNVLLCQLCIQNLHFVEFIVILVIHIVKAEELIVIQCYKSACFLQLRQVKTIALWIWGYFFKAMF